MHFDARPLTPSDGQEVTMVSDLMTNSGQWNEELIREIFIPVDAAAIPRIPLRSHDDDDCWAWEPEKHGIYSVKTAYQKLEQVHQQAVLPTTGCFLEGNMETQCSTEGACVVVESAP